MSDKKEFKNERVFKKVTENGVKIERNRGSMELDGQTKTYDSIKISLLEHPELKIRIGQEEIKAIKEAIEKK